VTGGKTLTVVFLHPIALDGECWKFLTSEQLEKQGDGNGL
jgi:hypothetical protein